MLEPSRITIRRVRDGWQWAFSLGPNRFQSVRVYASVVDAAETLAMALNLATEGASDAI